MIRHVSDGITDQKKTCGSNGHQVLICSPYRIANLGGFSFNILFENNFKLKEKL